MKRTIMTISMFLMGMTAVLAQGAFQEYLHCQTDKDFYLAGERMWFRLWSVDANDRLQQRSRVAYVELVGTETNDAHCMVELKNAGANGVIDLPFALPSGRYQLRAYTRNMLNLGDAAICHKTIAVMNTLRNDTTKDKVNVGNAMPIVKPSAGNISVATDKSRYGSRQKVNITIGQLPSKAQVAVSVARQDGYRIAQSAEFTPASANDRGIEPEVESQIITGRYVSDGGDEAARQANITLRSAAIHYYPGDINGDKVLFRTPLLNGVETIYTGAGVGAHINLDSPFVSTPLASLPAISIGASDETALQERSVGLQVARYFGTDSVKSQRVPVPALHKYKMYRHYDMDEYKRFNTFRETFKEYAIECGTTTVDGRRLITMFDEFTSQPNDGNTLVLLDGVAVMNHEDLLNYNPRLCKYLDIYLGHYVFGGEVYAGILNVRTANGQSSNFTLPSNSREVNYQGLQTNTQQTLVCGDDALTPLPANTPDARHTLYWNPSTQATQLACLTSDLKGTFVVTVAGFTPDGEKIEGTTTFTVE